MASPALARGCSRRNIAQRFSSTDITSALLGRISVVKLTFFFCAYTLGWALSMWVCWFELPPLYGLLPPPRLRVALQSMHPHRSPPTSRKLSHTSLCSPCFSFDPATSAAACASTHTAIPEPPPVLEFLLPMAAGRASPFASQTWTSSTSGVHSSTIFMTAVLRAAATSPAFELPIVRDSKEMYLTAKPPFLKLDGSGL